MYPTIQAKIIAETGFDSELEIAVLNNLIKKRKFQNELAVPNEVINRILYQQILEEMPLTIDEVEEVDYEISSKDYLNAGGEGTIYSLGNTNVGKVLYANRTGPKVNYSRILEEGVRQELAHRRGVKVPKVEGIFKIKKEDGKFCPALVMKKIDGFALDEFPSTSRDEDERYNFHLELGKSESEKARTLGIHNVDFGTCNMIADLRKKQTYLIDCSDWKIDGVDFKEIKYPGDRK